MSSSSGPDLAGQPQSIGLAAKPQSRRLSLGLLDPDGGAQHSRVPCSSHFARSGRASAAAQPTLSHEGAHPTAGQAVGRISITNLSNQTLAPIVVATDRPGLTPIFVPGKAASSELATLAETGSPQALEVMLRNDPSVLFATHLAGTATVIPPGATVSGDLVFDYGHTAVSVASMLVSTNDAFVAYSGAKIPTVGTNTYLAHAWDAGSEANTEACADVPGPPCSEDSGNARVTEGAEGIVLIHRGIHGTGDVIPSRYDWRGPVAMITVSGLGHGTARRQ